MALELDSRYPGRFNPGDADYPQGSFKNRTAPGALDGSYLEKDWANDKEGFFQRLMLVSGISPNGSVDTALNSQYYEALLQVIQDNSSIDYLNTLRIDVASAANINLTSSAPNTRHINITGTTTIAGFTVAAGQCYFVRFGGALTLTNSASLVTNSGADLNVLAGDSCIIQATAANTVEVLFFTQGVKRYSSGLLTITAAGSFTLNHGLGVKPDVFATLTCQTAEGGFSAGDEVQLSIDVQDGAAVASGMSIRKTSTQLLVKLGNASNVFILARADTGALITITPANWRLTIQAKRP